MCSKYIHVDQMPYQYTSNSKEFIGLFDHQKDASVTDNQCARVGYNYVGPNF